MARRARSFRLSDGEQSILLAFAGVGVFGAGVSFVVVSQLAGDQSLLRPLSAYDIWFIIAGVVGVWIGLYSGLRWMGHPGPLGWAKACVGVLWISFVGSLVGGSLALPLFGTMFGPFTLVVTLVSAPILAALWASSLLAAHALCSVWRSERDSLFRRIDGHAART